tara:strand:- start:158 stop:301 length:144 start_codon:yes stop_codon:yes gene_type:complete
MPGDPGGQVENLTAVDSERRQPPDHSPGLTIQDAVLDRFTDVVGLDA